MRADTANRSFASLLIVAVRFTFVIVVRQRRQVFHDRRPDRVEAHHVPAVHRGDAIRLRTRELEGVGLTKNPGERIGNAAASIDGAPGPGKDTQCSRLVSQRTMCWRAAASWVSSAKCPPASSTYLPFERAA